MPRFIPVEEVVDSLCLQTGDILKRNKGRYLYIAKDVWDDMNEGYLKIASRVKIPVRKICHVNKKTNSLSIPKNWLRVSSVNVIDHCGNFHPVYRNEKLTGELVEMSAVKDCACEFACGYRLCNTIKGYEAVVSTKTDSLPNGDSISFECVDRKYVDGQGFLYTETQYPQRIYLSGVWTDTVLHTGSTKSCKLEVDHNGCVCDTEENIDACCDSCVSHGNNHDGTPVGGTANIPPCTEDRSWIYYCNSKLDWFGLQCGGFGWATGKKNCNNIYNITEDGNTLVFPHDFGWEKVMLRGYVDVDLQDIMVPYTAKQTFQTGLQCFFYMHDPKNQNIAITFEKKYSKYKWGLFLELNKYRIAELAQIVVPAVYVPSYIHNWNQGWYQDGIVRYS